MRIALVTPFASGSLLGISYIQAYLKQNGISDVSVHLGIPPTRRAVRRLLRQRKPDLIGVTCFTTTRYEAFRIVQWTKALSPRTVTVLGGLHATFMHRPILERLPFVDYVVLGEGEETTLDLVRSLEAGRDPADVPGLAFRRNGALFITQSRPAIKDLDRLPFPGPIVGPDPFTGAKYEASLITARGCNGACIFCSNPRLHGRLRMRSPENIIEEINWAVSRRPVDYLNFFDDTFSADPERARRFCALKIENNPAIPFRIRTRVDCLDRDLVGFLARAGCRTIGVGIESGSARILENINKRIRLEQVEKVFRWTREAGIRAEAFFMVGNIGETGETIRETVAFAEKLRPDACSVSRAVYIFPGTKMYLAACREGALTEETWFSGPAIIPYTKENSLRTLSRWQWRVIRACLKHKGWRAFARHLLNQVRDLSPAVLWRAGLDLFSSPPPARTRP